MFSMYVMLINGICILVWYFNFLIIIIINKFIGIGFKVWDWSGIWRNGKGSDWYILD